MTFSILLIKLLHIFQFFCRCTNNARIWFSHKFPWTTCIKPFTVAVLLKAPLQPSSVPSPPFHAVFEVIGVMFVEVYSGSFLSWETAGELFQPLDAFQRLYSWFICFWLSKSNLWLQNFIWASSFHVKENNSNYVNLIFCSSGPMTNVATQCCAGRGIYPSHSTVGSGIQHSSFANVFLSSVNFINLIHDACHAGTPCHVRVYIHMHIYKQNCDIYSTFYTATWTQF